MAFSTADPRRRWPRGTRASPFVREHRVHFFEGFIARDAARLHTSDGEPAAALALFSGRDRRRSSAPATSRSSSSRSRASLRCSNGSAASSPPPRCSARWRSEPSSFHHVPELADARRTHRRRARRRSEPGSCSPRAPSRPRRRCRVRPRSRSRSPAATRAAPARRRAGWPEPARARGAAPPRRWSDVGRDRRRALHLDADRRAPRPAHLHEDRRLQPRLGDPLGGQPTGRRAADRHPPDPAPQPGSPRLPIANG